MLRALLACLAATVVTTAEVSLPPAESQDPLAAAMSAWQSVGPAPIVQFIEPSRWRIREPAEAVDPIAPLSEADRAALADGLLDAKDLKPFLDGYVERIAAHYADAVPADLAAWLTAHPVPRRDLWLALDPVYDDVPAALAVFNALRAKDAKTLERYYHLGIALAVVYDQRDAVLSSRYYTIWGMAVGQFPDPPEPAAIFAYFTDPKQQAQFAFKPDQLTWSLLVHVVDLDISPEDRTWAQTTEGAARKDPAPLYAAVPYDREKLAKKPTKLGSQPYSLPNLLKLGGVCGDQAHFTTRVAKTFCIPAMKIGGEGRFGGAGHAWAGYLAAAKGRPQLDFTGRYFFDYYYTGEVFDPQTRTFILDRDVAMLYDGVALKFESAQEASAMARAALAARSSAPAAALTLAKAAIDRNKYCGNAWRALWRLGADGKLPSKDSNKYLNRMFTDLAEHPDLTIECLDLAMRSIPDANVDERQKIYDQAAKLYAKRPDLQIALRMRQCADLVVAGRQIKALEVALGTVVPNAKEGALILPLVEYVTTTAKAYAASEPKFRMHVVKEQLAKADKDFPKKRGSEASEAYAVFAALVGSL